MPFAFRIHFHDTYTHVDINDIIFAMYTFMLMKLEQRYQSRKSCHIGFQRLELLTKVFIY